MRIHFNPLIPALLFWLFLCPSAAAQGNITESIVKIYTTYDRPNYFRPWQMRGQRSRIGSGCIISGNRVLTNAHVVSDHTFIRVRRAGQADKFVASVEAISHELDLAILSVKDKAFFEGARALQIGELPRVGDNVFAYGFPKGGTRITITEGIVSRIERKIYSHSRFENLVCQIDAAINPGSSGGPVISKGKIVGVIFQSTSGQNIGFMVPAPVIQHFFTDLTDGRHDGVPTLFIVWQNLENPQMREFLNMSKEQSGVLVKEVSPAFLGKNKLLPGDVILSVDNHDVANDETIVLRETERISFGYAIDRKQINDRVELEVLRKGRVLSLDIGLEVPRALYGYVIPRIQYETPPTYYIIGGLVFTRLTENFLNLWSKWQNVPIRLKKYYFEIITTENQERQDVVILMDILPDEVNVGYDDFKNLVITEVNGIKINKMRDLVDAFEKHDGNYHRILMEFHNAELVLSIKGLKRKSQNILQKYKVTADRSPDLKKPLRKN
jgi:S1-C subfamily serine protease